MKKEVKESKKEKSKEKNNTSKKKALILAICIVFIVGIVFIITFFVNGIKYKKYVHYEEKMQSYGFNKLYDNESAKTSESVTKSEAMKMAIGVCLNTFDIEDIANIPTDDYKNAIWVLYAQDAGLVNASDLNRDTENNSAKYIDVIRYFGATKQKLLKEKLVDKPLKQISDISKYEEKDKKAILDMLSNDILKELGNKLNGNRKVFKGQVNEIVVNYIEKYDLLEEKVQTDVTKLPSNSSDFAYISEDVDKSVYEIPYILEEDEESETGFVEGQIPKTCYTEMKDYYKQISEKIEKYYKVLLNVDYQTTTTESLKKDLYSLIVDDLEETDLNEYINHIKSNQIKLTGEAKVQDPIIYFDGSNYRVRTKVNFNVESSLTKNNLLFCDTLSDYEIVYDNKQNSLIVDTVIGTTLIIDTYYVQHMTLVSILPDNNNYGIHYAVSDDEIWDNLFEEDLGEEYIDEEDREELGDPNSEIGIDNTL